MSIGLGGIKVPGGVQASRPNNPAPPQLPAEYLAQLAEQNRVKKLVNAYKAAPQTYGESEALQLQQMAIGAGIPMEVQSSTGAKWGKGLLSMLDTATFGILVPDDLYAPVNEAERKAVGWGSMAGMVLPWGGPFRLAGAGLKGIKGLSGASKALKNPAVKNFMDGFRNPMGVGKVLPGFKNTTSATTSAATKKAVSDIPRVGKNFGKSMNSIIKKDKKSFWTAVNAQKTTEAKRKAAAGWLKNNMHKSDAGSKNMTARVEGWVKNLIKDPKTKNVAVKPKMLTAGAKPKQIGGGAYGADGSTIILGGGAKKKPKFSTKGAKDADIVEESIKRENQMEAARKAAKTVKTKVKGKEKIVRSTKTKHSKGGAVKKVKLTTSERSSFMASMKPSVRKRIQKLKGPSKDHAIIRWAMDKGLV